ncbi:MAG: NADH-quinone oxidoreductase subunit M [Chloroflexi bacterium]|nr:NADH-quinone oxidoreductase subunit M [Chloroflexota bacterium]
MSFPYLSAILFLPALGALVIALLPRPTQQTIRATALLFALMSLALSLDVFLRFDRSVTAVGLMQFEEVLPWFPAVGSSYHLGVDGISLVLLLLTTIIGVLSVLVSWKVSLRGREYFVWLLVLETSILGVFAAADLILFFIFWEVELVPMYFLISIWGTGKKEYSAIKYVIYTIAGSALMLAGILTLYFTVGTMDMNVIAATDLSQVQTVIPLGAMFLLLLIGFAIKLPVFPLHTWLPDAHTDAPTAVSVVLAGVLLKMGGYGMIRFNVGFFPDMAQSAAPLLAGLAVVNVLYGAAVTFRQTDLKRLIAYSSVSHMGLVLLGIFALTPVSLAGATLQMFSHGVVTGLLFAMVGLVYEKTHNRNLNELGGLARRMPLIAVLFSLAGLASLGLPGTSGFAAEFLVFVGSFTSTAFASAKAVTLLSAFGIVLTAGYVLWMLQRVFFGPSLEKYNSVPDADRVEMVCTFTFVALIILVGIYPAILTNVIQMGTSPLAALVGAP